MSGADDNDTDKTFEATPHKLQEARKYVEENCR